MLLLPALVWQLWQSCDPRTRRYSLSMAGSALVLSGFFYVLFALNCVYQEILGPLHASSQIGTAGLGTEHPIRYGSELFDKDHARRVRSAIKDFFKLVGELHFPREWMSKNTCGDLVYFIERKEREEEQG